MDRVAVMGERGTGNELNEQRWLERGKREKLERRGEPCGIAPSVPFLSFVLNFYFLKKNGDGDASRPIVVGLSV